jgi:hypothetical protein
MRRLAGTTWDASVMTSNSDCKEISWVSLSPSDPHCKAAKGFLDRHVLKNALFICQKIGRTVRIRAQTVEGRDRRTSIVGQPAADSATVTACGVPFHFLLT